MKSHFIVLLFYIPFFCYAQSDSIKQVKIGDQIWMVENLNVERFSNGDLIKEAKTKDEWLRASENKRPAWCYYNNDSANGVIYGKLYNWYAVIDPRGLAPKGWHIATDAEWEDLVESLGGPYKAGKKLKSKKGWEKNGNGNNATGFNALPGGFRYSISADMFEYIGFVGHWWMISSRYKSDKQAAGMGAYSNSCIRATEVYDYGASVRCIKNK